MTNKNGQMIKDRNKHLKLSFRAAKADTRLHMYIFSQENFVGHELHEKLSALSNPVSIDNVYIA